MPPRRILTITRRSTLTEYRPFPKVLMTWVSRRPGPNPVGVDVGLDMVDEPAPEVEGLQFAGGMEVDDGDRLSDEDESAGVDGVNRWHRALGPLLWGTQFH